MFALLHKSSNIFLITLLIFQSVPYLISNPNIFIEEQSRFDSVSHEFSYKVHKLDIKCG